jgi:pimeloyl-ACP methyl ester carboxylesterase
MPEITRNDVRLQYEEAGSGGPPLLFVHGFGGSSAHFAAQLEHFRRRHRVVAVDRRGHGRSDKPEGPYTIPAIAEEVGWTARELGLHKPVVVVHSMGSIGLELVRQQPDLASALVILDAPAFPPAPVRAMFEDLAKGLRSPAYAEVIEGVCDRLIFLPTDDKERRRRLHAGILETPQAILAGSWEHYLAYDPTPAASSCKVPLLYVNAVMPFDEARLRELCPQIQIGRTVGSGHMHQLEVPDQVNAMIERFLHVTAGVAR